ncbi:MAG: hypothetical protein IPJ65_30260 [Archangiaceae bacterium]|nr:hypothetical protein [Archangiaceae bacterium]
MWALTLIAALGTANPQLTQAMQKVAALDEAAALGLLDQAQLRSGNTVHDLALIELWRGLAHAGLSHTEAAQRAFDAALQLEPALTLPDSTSPLVRSWWEAAQRRRPAPIVLVPAETSTPPPAPVAVVSEPARPKLRGRLTGAALWVSAAACLGLSVWLGLSAVQHHGLAVAEPSVGKALALQKTAETEAIGTSALIAGGVALGALGGVLWGFDLL